MLVAKQIYKSYDQLKVLKGVSMEVQEGEIISLVGASGAGKSTLLHIIGTLDKADSGALQIKNTKIDSLKGSELAAFRNKNIGFVFQFHHLLPEFTALENVCLPAYIGGRSKAEAEHDGLALLTLLGLKDRAHHKPSELSGGEQQRTAVARALINKPALVIADEPSGNLDSANARELHQLFFRLRDQFKQTFIIATHNEELAAMADRRIAMRDGQITEA